MKPKTILTIYIVVLTLWDVVIVVNTQSVKDYGGMAALIYSLIGNALIAIVGLIIIFRNKTIRSSTYSVLTIVFLPAIYFFIIVYLAYTIYASSRV